MWRRSRGRSRTAGPPTTPTPTLTGMAEAGSTVTIYQNETDVGTATANVDEPGTFTPSGHRRGRRLCFTAMATDAAGNVSDASNTYTITLDTAAPEAPAIESAETMWRRSRGRSRDGGSTNDATPTLTVMAEAGSTVTIYQNETDVGTATSRMSKPVDVYLPLGELTEDGNYSSRRRPPTRPAM